MFLGLSSETLNILLAAVGGGGILSVILASRAWRESRRLDRENRIASRASETHEGFTMPEDQDPGLLARLGTSLRPEDASELAKLRLDLARAGRRSSGAVDTFMKIRMSALVISAAALMALVVAVGTNGFLLGGGLLLFGLLGPRYWLNGQIEHRQRAIGRAVPSCLDLLGACITAGLGLQQALSRVAAELHMSEPAMAEELAVVVGEVRAGLGVEEAFRKLSSRVMVDELRSLCAVIVQSAALGAPLAKALADYSDQARRKRAMSLEERAGEITAGLTLPLTLCLLPSALIAVLGPAIVTIVNGMG